MTGALKMLGHSELEIAEVEAILASYFFSGVFGVRGVLTALVVLVCGAYAWVTTKAASRDTTGELKHRKITHLPLTIPHDSAGKTLFYLIN